MSQRQTIYIVLCPNVNNFFMKGRDVKMLNHTIFCPLALHLKNLMHQMPTQYTPCLSASILK